jgi:drug/metabolite transporter (DMT)-like permease
MTTFALLLVGLSAFLHAFWNFLSKRRHPTATFFLMASITASMIYLPILYVFRAGLPRIPATVWILIVITGAVQAVYYVFLATAYRNGDLSHAYPLARSLPVVLVALVSVLLGRGAQIEPLAYAGFAVVTAGCLILPLPGFLDLSLRPYRQTWVIFALLAAFCITAYTLIDDQVLRTLRSLPEAGLSNLGWALLFGELETISLTLFMLVFVLSWKPERERLLHARWADWGRSALMGIIITATYALVLLAMAYVRNVSYVFAFRQLSIPIGAALGMLVRREPAYAPKLAGIGLVVAGLVLVAVG